jgi:hypothetical protein
MSDTARSDGAAISPTLALRVDQFRRGVQAGLVVLSRIRETMKKAQRAKDEEAQAFLREAVALMIRPVDESRK